MSDKIKINYCPKRYVYDYWKHILGQTTKLNSLPAGETNNHTLFHIPQRKHKINQHSEPNFLTTSAIYDF